MPIIIALLLALSVPAEAPSESFDAYFTRAISDPSFRLSRVASDFSAAEEITWQPDETHLRRPLRCTFTEIESAGWTILPDPDVLAKSSLEYSAPRFVDTHTAVVHLGPAESEADAEYHFKLKDGVWLLVHLTVFSQLESGSPTPPPICNNSR